MRVRTVAPEHPPSAWLPMASDESVPRHSFKTLRARIALFCLEKLLQEAPFGSDPIFLLMGIHDDAEGIVCRGPRRGCRQRRRGWPRARRTVASTSASRASSLV